MKRNNHHFLMAGLATGMLLTLVIASCSKKNDNSGNNTPPPTPKIQIQLREDTKFGKILTDSNGRSLYFFSNDAADSSTCYDACQTAWPVFYVNNPTVSDGLKSSDFGTTTRRDNSKQLTYKGWPLYYFASDAQPGDVKGDPVGRVWYVAKTDYTVMIANYQLVGNDKNQYDSLYNLVTPPTKSLTRYLVDFSGHTLYNFKNDSFNINKFTKADYSNNGVWPIDTLSTIGSVPSTLNKTDFGTISVVGRTQLTYKGRPLYVFGADSAKRGNNKGIAFPNANKPITWPYANESITPAPSK